MLSRLALALSAPLAGLDGPNLAFQDALNARAGRLWWPLAVPSAHTPMPPEAHALFLVHAWVIARVAGVPRGRAWAGATLAGWALFTGAWDRRALR